MERLSHDEIRAICDAHRIWLSDSTQGQCANVSNAKLEPGFVFDGMDLSFANFSHAEAQECSFRRCSLRSCDFRWADLWRGDFRSADLSYADLGWSDLAMCDFFDAVLSCSRSIFAKNKPRELKRGQSES